jgi:hypothetical protein
MVLSATAVFGLLLIAVSLTADTLPLTGGIDGYFGYKQILLLAVGSILVVAADLLSPARRWLFILRAGTGVCWYFLVLFGRIMYPLDWSIGRNRIFLVVAVLIWGSALIRDVIVQKLRRGGSPQQDNTSPTE